MSDAEDIVERDEALQPLEKGYNLSDISSSDEETSAAGHARHLVDEDVDVTPREAETLRRIRIISDDEDDDGDVTEDDLALIEENLGISIGKNRVCVV